MKGNMGQSLGRWLSLARQLDLLTHNSKFYCSSLFSFPFSHTSPCSFSSDSPCCMLIECIKSTGKRKFAKSIENTIGQKITSLIKVTKLTGTKVKILNRERKHRSNKQKSKKVFVNLICCLFLVVIKRLAATFWAEW